jgi:hypothetical protein
MSNDWNELAKIAAALFEKELQTLSKLTEQHASVNSRQAQLGAANDAALKELSQVHVAHKVNGDVLWQAWVGNNKQALGQEEARVRAQKEVHMPAIRKAFGRKTVTQQLARQSRPKPHHLDEP